MDWEQHLHDTICRHDITKVKLAINNGVNINILVGDYSESLLFIAYEKRNFELVEFLISEGIDVNLKDDIGDTVLTEAIQIEDFEFAEFLIDNGADLSLETYHDYHQMDLFISRRSARRESAFACALYFRKLLGRDVANLIGLMVWMDRK